jgi:hypothetical protein
MMKRKAVVGLFLGFGAACAADAPRGDELGIAKVEVNETGPRLHIIGVNADGKTIAEVDLRTGTYTMDPDLREGKVVPPDGVVDGRYLMAATYMDNVADGALKVLDESIGYSPLRIPLMRRKVTPPLYRFLQLPEVVSALGRWGVEYIAPENRPATSQTGVAYTSLGPYTPQNFSAHYTNKYGTGYGFCAYGSCSPGNCPTSGQYQMNAVSGYYPALCSCLNPMEMSAGAEPGTSWSSSSGSWHVFQSCDMGGGTYATFEKTGCPPAPSACAWASSAYVGSAASWCYSPYGSSSPGYCPFSGNDELDAQY